MADRRFGRVRSIGAARVGRLTLPVQEVGDQFRDLGGSLQQEQVPAAATTCSRASGMQPGQDAAVDDRDDRVVVTGRAPGSAGGAAAATGPPVQKLIAYSWPR